jgi:hypothetical protein
MATSLHADLCGFQDIVKRKHIRMIPDLMVLSIRAHRLKDLDKIMHTSRGQA